MDRLCMGCMREYDDQFEICPYCGYIFNTKAEQSYHISPGSVLQGRYIVGRVLGFGGFGVTYVGKDYLMDRKVAIKEYLPSEFATRMSTQQNIIVYSGDKEEQFKEGLAKMLDEAQRLAKFEAIPGIVQIYDCFEANGTSYIIMEYLEGMSLKEYLRTHGKMTMEQALPVTLQIASAMAEVHKTKILHRDIAPDNIYVLNPDEPDNLEVKLLDFGAARQATTKYNKGLSVIIKPGYAPEEQYSSRGDQGTWTDVYALAATLYKMITGITPEDALERSAKDELKKPSQIGVKITKATETAIMNALNIKIQDRTQTMEEFCKELMSAEVKKRKITKIKIPVAALLMAGMLIFTGLVATGKIDLQMQLGESHLGKGKVRVPNLINEDKEKAERLLKKIGLSLKEGEKTYSEEIEENKISSQDFKENTTVDKGTPITVNFSLGKEKGAFPQVVGVDRDEAMKLLEESRFTNIREEEIQDEGVFNSVLSVSEKPGDNVELTKEIILTICKNETAQEGDASVQIEVPDVAGKGKEDAEAALEEAGFGVQWAEEFSEQEEGSILEQNPAAGEKANKGSIVKVHISIGPEKLYMINVELKTLEEAEKDIGELGLELGEVKKDYCETVESGKVISQSIPKDTEINPGDKVDLVISLGEKPASVQKEETKPAQTQKPKPTQPQTSALPSAVLPSSAPVPETSAPAEEEKTSGEKNTTGGVNGVGGSGAQEKAPTETTTLSSNEQPAPTPSPNIVFDAGGDAGADSSAGLNVGRNTGNYAG